MPREHRDLSTFDELSERKAPWVERSVEINKQFPSVARLDWGKLFTQDPHVAGRIIGDILKIDQAPRGRVGKRASLDPERAAILYRQLIGEDFTTLPFHEAFRMLIGKRSLRGVAHRIEVSHTHVDNLLKNLTPPSIVVLEKTAKMFNKKPDFFIEYRVAYIIGLLAGRLDSSPEASIILYRNIQRALAS